MECVEWIDKFPKLPLELSSIYDKVCGWARPRPEEAWEPTNHFQQAWGTLSHTHSMDSIPVLRQWSLLENQKGLDRLVHSLSRANGYCFFCCVCRRAVQSPFKEMWGLPEVAKYELDQYESGSKICVKGARRTAVALEDKVFTAVDNLPQTRRQSQTCSASAFQSLATDG